MTLLTPTLQQLTASCPSNSGANELPQLMEGLPTSSHCLLVASVILVWHCPAPPSLMHLELGFFSASTLPLLCSSKTSNSQPIGLINLLGMRQQLGLFLGCLNDQLGHVTASQGWCHATLWESLCLHLVFVGLCLIKDSKQVDHHDAFASFCQAGSNHFLVIRIRRCVSALFATF